MHVPRSDLKLIYSSANLSISTGATPVQHKQAYAERNARVIQFYSSTSTCPPRKVRPL